MTSKKWLLVGAIFAGALGGGFATASNITILEPYKLPITAVATCFGAIVSWLIIKSNEKTN